MCGIIGYQGPKNIKEVLIKGLQTLEYRGYDSAGIAVLDKGHIRQFRTTDSLASLDHQIKPLQFDGHLGIGHTRWATHGKVSEQNAHPHSVKGLSIVHNGIIENHNELREKVLATGAKILSQTDSEVIAHLLSIAFEKTKDILQAVLQVIPELKGSYAVLVITEKQPETWIAFKSGPPLVLGVHPSEVFIASDIQPLIPYTNQVIYLQDNEIVKIENTKYQIFDRKGHPIDKDIITLSQKAEDLDKKGYPHFMLKEIFEQSVTLRKVLSQFLDPTTQTIHLGKTFSDVLKDAQRIFIVACGSSYYAGLVGKYLIEGVAKIPVDVELASQFRYNNPLIQPHTLCVFISQSGETADTLAALRLAKDRGHPTLSICNMPHSTIDREADAHIYMSAGIEVGVASTKTFTNTLAILNILAYGWHKFFDKENFLLKEQSNIYEALTLLPTQVEKVLGHDLQFQAMAENLKNCKGVLYMGRGIHFPIALEGALKLKELAYIHASAYPAGEMKHGPIALIDSQVTTVVMIPKDNLYEKTKNNLEEIRARGGKIIAITTDEGSSFDKEEGFYPVLPKAHDSVLPILEAIVVQMIAYHVACQLGNNVDRPRNLAKSVTVE